MIKRRSEVTRDCSLLDKEADQKKRENKKASTGIITKLVVVLLRDREFGAKDL